MFYKLDITNLTHYLKIFTKLNSDFNYSLCRTQVYHMTLRLECSVQVVWTIFMMLLWYFHVFFKA